MMYLTTSLLALLAGLASAASLPSQGSPNIEKVLTFKTTLANYSMGYSSASFAVHKDVIYVANGANVGNAVLKFGLNGTYLGEYPGWYNFPHDIIVGGDDQVLVSALGAMNDTGTLRYGLVLYTKEGDFLHGLHEADSGLMRPWGLAQGMWPGRVLTADWAGNKTYVMEFDWSRGEVGEKMELADVEWPTNIKMTSANGLWTENIAILSLVCCQLEEFIKISLYNVNGNLVSEATSLPSGGRISNPRDVASDPSGNIIISDGDLGTFVLSGDLKQELGKLPLDDPPMKMLFYKDQLYVLYQLQTVFEPGNEQYDSFISVYNYHL